MKIILWTILNICVNSKPVVTIEEQLQGKFKDIIINSQNTDLRERNINLNGAIKKIKNPVKKIKNICNSKILNKQVLLQAMSDLLEEIQTYTVYGGYFENFYEKIKSLVNKISTTSSNDLPKLINEILTNVIEMLRLVGCFEFSLQVPELSLSVLEWEKEIKVIFFPLFKSSLSFINFNEDIEKKYKNMLSTYQMSEEEKVIMSYLCSKEDKKIVLDLLEKRKRLIILTKIFREKQTVEYEYFIQLVINILVDSQSIDEINSILNELSEEINKNMHMITTSKHMSHTGSFEQNCRFYQGYVNKIYRNIKNKKLLLLMEKLNISKTIGEFVDSTRRLFQHRNNYFRTLLNLIE